ncbi:MAG: PSP1 C-terminal domain-containing protein, partial [Candidatus Absconditabacteria bacterium]
MASSFFVLDWYTNKYVTVVADDLTFLKALVPGDKIVYNLLDQYGVSSLSVGTYMPHQVQTDRKGTFARLLSDEEKIFFEEQQQFALKIFPLFKKKFKVAFPGSTPVTARFQIFNDQIYFYFYSEERYVFTDFVKDLRQRLDKNIFLFQIGA